MGGHFEFEKLPGVSQRFYGVNFCFTGNYPTHEQADQVVTRLVRLGYNTIRVHHYERDLVGWKGGIEFNPEMIDRLDYFLAAAIRQGLYVTTDLFVSRPVAWKDIGLADRGPGLIPEKGFYKCLVALWDPAFEDWKKFSEKFLLHVNPYTGRRYLDEPAMPLISLINEGQLTMGWTRKNYAAREDPIIRDAWTKWLAERRAADPAFCPDAPTAAQDVSSYGTNNAAFAHFMADVERRSASRMIAFLRKLGSRALFTNANCGPHYTPMQFTREDCYDYVDDHSPLPREVVVAPGEGREREPRALAPAAPHARRVHAPRGQAVHDHGVELLRPLHVPRRGRHHDRCVLRAAGLGRPLALCLHALPR